MRYIGNKENIINRIHKILVDNGVEGERFFDFFSGTANVARFYKSLGYAVSSSDMMYMSYCLQKAYIENNCEPTFESLLSQIPNKNTLGKILPSPLDIIITYLDNIPYKKGFIYNNYTPEGTDLLAQPRMYFSNENGQRIDAIRQQIEEWKKENFLTEYEYYILLSCLIESVSFYANIAGVYAAFHKKWDPRALKPLKLRPISLCINNKKNKVYHGNSLALINQIKTDILYLDPPYNARQYLPNYHLLETIAKYDNPEIRGVAGLRNYDDEKSSFCNAKTALYDLERIAGSASFNFLVMSYNSEGIMKEDDIIKVLSKFGVVRKEQFPYTRFKSNNGGLAKTKRQVYEQLYILYK